MGGTADTEPADPVLGKDLEDDPVLVPASEAGQLADILRVLSQRREPADQPEDCEFILPAIARSGRVSVAVSTDGASPALARELRNLVADLLTPQLAALAEQLAAERAEVQARGESTEDVDWTKRVRDGIAAATEGRSLAP